MTQSKVSSVTRCGRRSKGGSDGGRRRATTGWWCTADSLERRSLRQCASIVGEDEGLDEDGCIARFSDSYRPADRLVRLERSLDSAKLLLFESVPHSLSYTTIHFANNTCQSVFDIGCAVSSSDTRVRSLPSFTMADHSSYPSCPTRRCRGRHGQGLALHALEGRSV